ncbi:hypothetical protein [Streptomyces werraensis]|uniref:hypothetical protein n=1 Tax=Streptomyces werraensis TaxID=68284 RepID=UPI0034392D8B
MASRRKGSPDPTKPLVRQVRSVGPVDARALVGELRQFHEEAEDPGIERMPADEEVYGALLYAEKRAGSLRALPVEKQKAAALIRVLLWEFLSERLRVHQSTAIDDARSAGAEWRELAPALAVGTPSAAYNKARRLQAGSLTDAVPGTGRVRRTPEAVRQAEDVSRNTGPPRNGRRRRPGNDTTCSLVPRRASWTRRTLSSWTRTSSTGSAKSRKFSPTALRPRRCSV